MKLTSLIGKQILSPAGENLGYVLAAHPSRDMKKLSSLLCADGDENEFFLSAKSLRSCGDALIAGKTRIPAKTGVDSPVGRAVYSDAGESLGTVCELVLGPEGESELIVAHSGAEHSYPLSRVLTGDTFLIYPEGMKKPAKKTGGSRAGEKRKTRAKQGAQKAKKSAPAKQTERADSGENDNGLNRLNLLGRRLKKTVFDEDGFPIALAGEQITPLIVATARRKNRLLQLTVNTLTNVL